MTILDEMAVEAAVKLQLQKVYGEETEAAFDRIYERERKSTRQVLSVLLSIKSQR